MNIDQAKAKVLTFVTNLIKELFPHNADYTIEIIYWDTDHRGFGPRVAEISGISADGRSGWSIMQYEVERGLHVCAVVERLLLYYILAVTDPDPDDGHGQDAEDHELALRSLLKA